MHIYRLFLGLIGESATYRRWGGGFGGGNGSRGRREGRTGSHSSRTFSYVEGFALRPLRLRSRHHFRYRMLRDLKCFVHQSDLSNYVTSLPSLGIPHDAFHHVTSPARRSLYVSLVVRSRDGLTSFSEADRPSTCNHPTRRLATPQKEERSSHSQQVLWTRLAR